MSTTGAVVRERDVIRVSGTDSVTYLQGQLSQDVDVVGVGASAWSLVLQPTGRVQTWLRMHRVGSGEFLLDLDAGHGEAAITRLDRFRLRSDVSFEAEPGWSMVSVRGLDAAEHQIDAELSAEVTWPGFEGVDHLGPGVTIPDGVQVFDSYEFEALRIAAGWPLMGAELTHDTIPAEAGGELLASSVSFTKGCYTGQELVARIESRGGNVPRPIRVLVGPPGGILAIGASVELAGAEVGRVTSAVRGRSDEDGLALASVLRKVEPGAAVTVGDVSATVRLFPV